MKFNWKQAGINIAQVAIGIPLLTMIGTAAAKALYCLILFTWNLI